MSTSKIELFDHIRLHDGRTGHVVEIYDMPGLPIGYEIELDDTKMELETVSKHDIAEVL